MKRMFLAGAAGIAIGYLICKIQIRSQKYRAKGGHLSGVLPDNKRNEPWGKDEKEIEYL